MRKGPVDGAFYMLGTNKARAKSSTSPRETQPRSGGPSLELDENGEEPLSMMPADGEAGLSDHSRSANSAKTVATSGEEHHGDQSSRSSSSTSTGDSSRGRSSASSAAEHDEGESESEIDAPRAREHAKRASLRAVPLALMGVEDVKKLVVEKSTALLSSMFAIDRAAGGMLGAAVASNEASDSDDEEEEQEAPDKDENHAKKRKRKLHKRYFEEDVCENCGMTGHSEWDCVEPRLDKDIVRYGCVSCGVQGHKGLDCPKSIRCARCHRLGHLARMCTLDGPPRLRAFKKYEYLRKCFVCGEEDHLLCLTRGSVDEVGRSPACPNCGESTHALERCPYRRADEVDNMILARSKPTPFELALERCDLARASRMAPEGSTAHQQKLKNLVNYLKGRESLPNEFVGGPVQNGWSNAINQLKGMPAGAPQNHVIFGPGGYPQPVLSHGNFMAPAMMQRMAGRSNTTTPQTTRPDATVSQPRLAGRSHPTPGLSQLPDLRAKINAQAAPTASSQIEGTMSVVSAPRTLSSELGQRMGQPNALSKKRKKGRAVDKD
ncbi:Cellular nucleic acid-binding protein-like [Porphyridium purpureum]|uniref:Cellular nucleic acid-binding protein-like n=1 Tax=Porphyridium purpureum TaxID=35688 RepID=A0A5J4Z3P6_PORPP|nr:Cellular nucleic acid-binding protein-like [Porphyridium purpureum]|eukprot:POR8898..scf295_1